MASKPGLLTEWPWKKLGSFKVFFYSTLHFSCIFFLARTRYFQLKSKRLVIESVVWSLTFDVPFFEIQDGGVSCLHGY